MKPKYSMENELKPCPFCGGAAAEEGGKLMANIASPFAKTDERFVADWRIGCRVCGIWIARKTFYDFDPGTEGLKIIGEDGRAEVIRVWNRRCTDGQA